jgi:colanic acid biosynthesis glycosyl transferase WcaI
MIDAWQSESGSRRRIRIVSQVFHPDSQITGVLLARLAVGLTRHGFECRVFAGFPVAERERQAGPVPRREVWQGITIERGGPRANAKAGLILRAWSYAGFLLWLFARLVFSPRSRGRVLVVTNPPFAPWIVALAAALRGTSFSVLVHDVYPEGLMAVGLLRPGWAASAWHAINRRVYARAERVFVLGRDMRDLLANAYGVPSERLVLAPNWNPHPAPAPGSAEATRLWQRLGLRPGSFVVQYSGNMGLWHDLDTIVRAAQRLLDLPDLCFVMIGGGRRRAPAQRLAEELRCANMRWLPFQPVEELDDSLACCHVALISQRAELEGVAVPSKLYGILSAGRAVVAQVPANSEAAQVVREESCGWVVPPHDAEALAACLRRACAERAEVAAAGRRAATAYGMTYDECHAVARVASALNAEADA